MGSEISRQKRTASRTSLQQSNISLDRDYMSAWAVIETIPFDGWSHGAAQVWGFDLHTVWQSRRCKVHKKPWSDFTVTGKGPRGKDGKICTFKCEVFETGREEKLTGWVKDMSVIGINHNVMVVQIVLSRAVKIMVLDCPYNRLLGTYTFGFNKEPCFQECFISNSGQYILFRQNFHLRRRLGHRTCFDSNIRVLQVKDGICKRLYVIEDSLVQTCFGSALAFDPRFQSRQIAIFSNVEQATSEPSLGIQLFDLQQRKCIKFVYTPIHSIIHHIKYSPDGCVIAALCVDFNWDLSVSKLFLNRICVFHGDSLRILHSMSFHNAPCKPFNADMYPMFSASGSLMAQYTGDDLHTVNIVQLPPMIINLQHQCRRVILAHISPVGLDELPLPNKLIQFLKFDEPCDFEEQQ